MLTVKSPIVSVDWLHDNLSVNNLIILDATIQKVGTKSDDKKEKQQIQNAVFFDLKNIFLDVEGEYPNTVPSEKHFENEAQKLGINNDSCVVVYDDLGVYSAPRVWWLFRIFGFTNIAVLNGGLPAWKDAGYIVELKKERKPLVGNFKTNLNKEKISVTEEVLKASRDNKVILDARSKGRFYATEPEPRKDLRGGHIPNSKSLPYAELQLEGKMKSKEELQKIFSDMNPNKEEMIFSCGSGITACILALGAEESGNTNYSVYDGSWTEWASRLELPVEK
ncbi:sulfurtransferase [Tenacibaculum discolor]|uniref:Rhodanese-like domain-containing protein n=1 Tax=Tenacibaculum discolor TaxID=361581 RepID=A0A2G1BRN6_9FLAO|nr:rhodanese-like domain-containing protein [Tenacibaculum discolor]MDP2541743.1 rhodanese-like domain-containing protein [Tenacibaculum discolor]PHN96245.1 sulfurtransferase [Tenacibaculum discolor]PHO00562.1 sulfurtransferase [Rhodobacteraceae bacterium 4F10]